MSSIVVLSVIWFFLFVLSHTVAFHIFNQYSRAKIISYTFKLAVIGLLSSILFCSKTTGFVNGSGLNDHIVLFGYVNGLAIFVSLFILYMPFYYTISASLSVQSMIMISDNTLAKKPTELSWLREQFTSKKLIHDRLDLMIINGYIHASHERYYLSPKGRFIAEIFSKFKKIWRLGPGG